jgi:Holliday junction DNA helicase RuvB
VLFIDEVHRLPRTAEEVLYPAMEDFALDIVLGKGPGARSVRLTVPKFTQIITRNAALLDIKVDAEGAAEIARRSRGTPRIANRLLRRVRDYAQVRADGTITVPVARAALDFEGVDHLGLDGLDRELLRVLIQTYNGGPTGVEALAASLHEDTETLEEVVEPFLLKIGLIARTSAGRRATAQAYSHLGLAAPESPRTQGNLWQT